MKTDQCLHCADCNVRSPLKTNDQQEPARAFLALHGQHDVDWLDSYLAWARRVPFYREYILSRADHWA
jgi:hypothetical protein